MIEEDHGRRSVRAMCEALAVSPSAYYAWRARPETKRMQSDRRLLTEIRAVHRESGETYGALRVHAELRARGAVCGKNRIARLMCEHDVRARRPKRRPPTSTSTTPLTPVAANVLDRSFSPDAPDRVWAVDMTYIATGEGWLYLSVVLDLHSRRVVGWSAQPSLTRRGPVEALTAALRDRRPAPGLVHHSDQGSQYTSDEYRSLLRRHSLVASMSRRGNCHDNAPTESFFASLKSDVVPPHRGGVEGRRFETHAEARSVLFAYIETFYNRRRRHSSLGYLTPDEHEQRHRTQLPELLAA
jgi:transposase InsO family protein